MRGRTADEEASWARRVAFLGEVESETAAHRIRRAERLRAQGRARRRERERRAEIPTTVDDAHIDRELAAQAARDAALRARVDDVRRLLRAPENLAIVDARAALGESRVRDARDARAGQWHEQRARGHEERFDRVVECGERATLSLSCEGCGDVTERAVGCSIGALCRRCKQAIIERRRARVLGAIEATYASAEARGLTKWGKGRFSGKFLTLTAPHEGDAAARVRRMREAVPRFFRRVRAAWRKAGIGGECAYVWAREWTPGDDGQGHPHVHLWLFCPFLDRQVALAWWQKSLAETETGCVDAPRAILDIRTAGGPQETAAELIKYMTKDVLASGELVDARTYARCYELHDGLRICQGSRGFMARAPQHKSCCPWCLSAVRARILKADAPAAEARAAAVAKVRGHAPLAARLEQVRRRTFRRELEASGDAVRAKLAADMAVRRSRERFDARKKAAIAA